ncbi:MAG: serine/threonine protein kinase [Myxococcaceae bacterium]|jgi:serine/threonine-protein kinase|nr:serine/threonine protein kinase [Myxococcaceae bacterium]
MDDRVKRFARGQLAGAELEAFERDLDRDPQLRRAVAAQASTEEGVTLLPPGAVPHEAPNVERGLVLQRVLGRGGMARVLLARQLDLGRDVAVKVVKEPGNASLTQRLLKEARLTGALEHPVIVPVHYLTTDEAGDVQVVLKRVEGEPWSALKDDAEAVRARFGAELFDWNVRVLIAVCGALGFAHERGVIHRDVKTSNVMVGRHGEVYLVDWGLGGLLTPDETGLLPWVGEAMGAGTLAFMAPEQFPGARHPLSAATDVYLLGGVLFELLTGTPPFPGRSSVADGGAMEPPPPRHVSASLEPFLSIARRALEPEPARRFPTAADFRLALEQGLKRRDAERLADRAEQLLASADGYRDAGARSEASRAATEAAFTLRLARESGADAARVDRLEERHVRSQVEAALADGRPAVAAQVLSSHGRPVPALALKVKAATEEASRREQLGRELDPALGRRRRVWFVFTFAVQSTVFYTARLVFPQLYTGRWALVVSSAIFLAAFLGLMFVFRDVVRISRLNRHMAQLIIVLTAGQVATRAATAALDLPRNVGAAVELPVLLTTLLAGAVTLHWSYGVGAFVCVLGQVAALVWPGSAQLIFFLSALGAIISVGIVWAGWLRHHERSSGG